MSLACVKNYHFFIILELAHSNKLECRNLAIHESFQKRKRDMALQEKKKKNLLVVKSLKLTLFIVYQTYTLCLKCTS